jgi:hypothetical protein
MRKALVVAASLAIGAGAGSLYHALYAAAVTQVDDPWLSRPGFEGPRILNAGVIRVELDHPAGLAPHPDAVARLDARIEDLTGQPVEVDVQVEDIRAVGKVTLDEISTTERSYRDAPHVSGDSAGIYILYVRGEFAESDQVLGIAYAGYSVVVFREIVESAGTPRPGGECAGLLGPTPCEIERAVLVHEVGHLLGLVNINYESKSDHWDDTHGHHCSDESCVMYWQIEVRSPLPGPPPDTFDPACRDDIAQIRAGWRGAPPRFWADAGYATALVALLTAPAGCGIAVAWTLGRGRRPRGGGTAESVPVVPVSSPANGVRQ